MGEAQLESLGSEYQGADRARRWASGWMLTGSQAALAALLTWVGQYKTDPVFGRLNDVFDLTALLTGLLGLCTVLVVLVRQRLPKPCLGDAAFGLLAFTVLVGALVAPSQYGGIKALTFMTAGLLLYAAGRFLLRKALVSTYLHILLVSSFYVVLASLVWGNWVGFRLEAGAGTNYLGVGRAAGTAAALSFVLAGERRSPICRAFLRLAFFVAVVAMLAAAARGPFVAFICAMAIFWSARRQRFSLKIIGGLVAALLIIAVVLSPVGAPLMGRLRVLDSPLEDPSIGTRLRYYSTALSVIVTDPLGIGTGQFPSLVGTSGRGYPHNIFLEVAVENGWVGLVALAALVGVSLVAAIRMIRGNVAPAVGVLIVMALVNALFSGDLNDQRLLWSVCGIAQASRAWGIRQG